ncbi:inositol monophosphatase family protein [Nocardia sp. NPDC057353]|uniref:inositol monophosphatase family protein n=1 Tax=Nocardia sp. NPDC057353 TaxID=3346104 RepID=UPI00363EE1F2
MSDLREPLDTARRAVRLGAELLSTTAPGRVEAKGDRDFVTDLDVQIQERIQRFLAARTPEIGFLGEEGETGPAAPSSKRWVLDPIDGTSNFIHGLPLCAVSLAMIEGDRPLVGVINAPMLDLEYWATRGGGARRNGEAIRAGTAHGLGSAIVSIGDYAVGEGAVERNRRRLAITAALAAKVERVRMFGSAALDLAWVAEGRTDGCVMLSNKPWDTAAGVLIARESGAIVTDSDGSAHTIASRHTVAAAPGVSAHLLRLLDAPDPDLPIVTP